MTKVVNFPVNRKKILFFVVGLSVLLFTTLPRSRVLKRDIEIDNILKKDLTKEYCIQYALITTSEGYYPCYDCLDGKIYLYIGEVWKYGKTCNGEEGRYPNGLPIKNLAFIPQFYGTEQQCLIQEKYQIYSYPLLPECQQREEVLIRPPGNKIDR